MLFFDIILLPGTLKEVYSDLVGSCDVIQLYSMANMKPNGLNTVPTV